MKGTLVSRKTFRYFTHGDVNKATTLIYVLHGYGQLAEYFIRKFHFLCDDYFIVAPEGMHRFYLEGTAGRVGASWMTKEERETDISDNLNWLSELDEHFSQEATFKNKYLLGFSQGGATAARWYFNQPERFSNLIMWASIFPPDQENRGMVSKNNSKKNIFVLGKEDPYYNDEQQVSILEEYAKLGFNLLTFNGKHDIETKTLQTVLDNLNSK